MELLTEESSFSRSSREKDEGRYVGGNWILWLAAIAVLVGLNFASWSFCMWVFGQPEHPMNYKLLMKLEKLDPLKGFNQVTAPRGKFYSAKDLYSQVYPFNPSELNAYNGILKRYYLKNYLERDDVTFLKGDFEVVSVRRLNEDDIFPTGLAIRAQANTFPDAFIDLVLPSKDGAKELFRVGDPLSIEESATCAAVIHVHRDENDGMTFTAVPLVERKFMIGAGSEEIFVSPPGKINIGSDKWPVSDRDGVPNPLGNDTGEIEEVRQEGEDPVPDGEREASPAEEQ